MEGGSKLQIFGQLRFNFGVYKLGIGNPYNRIVIHLGDLFWGRYVSVFKGFGCSLFNFTIFCTSQNVSKVNFVSLTSERYFGIMVLLYMLIDFT